MHHETKDILAKINRRRRRNRFFRWLFRGLKWLAILLVILSFVSWLVLQSNQFQNWAIDKVTTRLSKDLNTTVDVAHIDIDFFNKLVLEGFYVEDQQGDTLLYSRKLKTSLSANLLAILGKDLDIDEVHLEGARFNINRAIGQQDNNLQFILDYINPPNKEKKVDSNEKGKAFFLDVDALYLDDVIFVKDDKVSGQYLYAEIPNGKILIDELNLPENLFKIKTVELNTPIVKIEEREGNALPTSDDENEEEEEQENIPDSTKKELALEVAEFLLTKGQFSLDNFRNAPTKTTPDNELDFDHLHVFNIDIDIEKFSYSDWVFKGQANKIALEESGGFVLNQLSAMDATVSDRKIELNTMKLITPYSNLGDTLVMKYRSFQDFKDFPNKVLMKGKFNNAKVALRDILVFAKKLSDNAFFAKNKDEVVEIDGLVSGKVINLRGRNLTYKLGNSIFKGNFSTRNLTIKNEEILNLNVEQLQTNMTNLRLLLPNFNPPANFDKLGNIDFKGRFDGFFQDFVADGELSTDLGRAAVDMRLDLKEGRQSANYSGSLSLTDFDLGIWSGNKNLGKVTFSSEVKDGVGLTAQTANAKLGATVKDFTFKNYTYRNFTMEGYLDKNNFDGKASMKDENIDFVFDGSVELADSIPIFDFKAKVNRLDLKSLNLIKDDFVLAADLDLNLKDLNISKMEGRAAVFNFEAKHNQDESYTFDSLVVTSEFDNNKRHFEVNSEILRAELDGNFDIQQVPDALMQFFVRNYPEFATQLDIKDNNKTLNTNRFDYFVEIFDSKNFMDLVDDNIDTLRSIVLKGRFDNELDSIDVDLEIPQLKIGEVELVDIVLLGSVKESEGDIDLGVYSTNVRGKQKLAPVSVLGLINRDTLEFGINASDFTNVFDDLNINGLFFKNGDYFQVEFLPSDLIVLNEKWNLEEDNYVRFGKNYVEAQNFVLQAGQKKIILESTGEKGLTLGLEKFDLSIIDEYWDYKELDFNGIINITAEAEDILKLKGFTATAVADTLLVNMDDWGVFRLDADMADLKSPIKAYISITNNDEQLTVEGFYQPKLKDKSKPSNFFDFDINITNYPLNIARYWIGSATSDIIGRFDARAKLDGPPNKPNIGGMLRIYDGAITVDYLNTRYFIEDENVKITNYMFGAIPGSTILDEEGNRAFVEGGISHNHLKNLGLDARIYTKDGGQFLALNTAKGDNELFYGKAIGSADVRFSGNFKQTEIDVQATSGKGTNISIPISYEKNASDLGFIKFKKSKEEEEAEKNKKRSELRGIDLDMNITATTDAEMKIIFDESAGDVIKGTGNGNLNIVVTREGDFDMYGDYIVEEGEYLFTTFNNLINKPFVVDKGGRIRWSGDPYKATIDLEAKYKDLRTSLYTFLVEYYDGMSPNGQNELQNPTPVDLTMYLKGNLLTPDINFEIDFPNLFGELKNYTDSKMRIIRQDQNELNRQVFGLMVFGGFLPSGTAGALAGKQTTAAVNTVSELVSNQLSIYLTDLLQDIFTDIDFISSVDIDVDYNQYETGFSSSSGELQTSTGSEFAFRMKNNLFNDRLSVNIGGNVSNNNLVEQEGSYLAGDFVIEYVLTKDRNFKLRAYSRADQTIDARRNRIGAGLSYRKEFNTFKEFLTGAKRTARKAKRDARKQAIIEEKKKKKDF